MTKGICQAEHTEAVKMHMSALFSQSGMTTHITLILPHHTRCVTGTVLDQNSRDAVALAASVLASLHGERLSVSWSYSLAVPLTGRCSVSARLAVKESSDSEERVKTVNRAKRYSYRNATMGSTRVARRAGM